MDDNIAKTQIFEKTLKYFLAPIDKYLNDPEVMEIMINSARDIYVEKSGHVQKIPEKFESEENLRAAVNNVLQYTGKRISQDNPLVDSRLPDGSRVHVVLYPLCRNGTCVTIRKFAKITMDADFLLKSGTWTREAMDYLHTVVKSEKNLLVAGGTSSGKTSLLNVLSSFIPEHSRIVTIEDSAELELEQDHVISLEGRPPDRWGRGAITIRDLFNSALRLRPDRIVIGEVRGPEGLDMIQAMTSGHAGSMSTLHANTALDTLNRLETMAMMSKLEIPLHALRSQIASAIDVVVLTMRLSDGRRIITEVAEALSLDDKGHYLVRPVFEYRIDEKKKGARGALVWTGNKSSFAGQTHIEVHRDIWGDAERILAAESK